MDSGWAIASCAAAVGALLYAEQRGSQRGKWLAKPWASLSFVVVALASGAAHTAYGHWILVGLVLCLLGDLLLIPSERPRWFRLGIGAFLLGHAAFVCAFVTRTLDARWLAAAALLAGVALAVVWRWLAPRLSAEMKSAVAAYLVVIGAMVACACAVTGAGGPNTVALGALCFAVSDISVARDRFVQPGFANRAWGLPLYYFAQVLLATTPAAMA